MYRGAGGDRSRWASAFAPGAAEPTVNTDRVQMAAGWSWQGDGVGICARRSPLLWDAIGLRWLPWSDADGAALVRRLLDGALILATDDLLALWTPSRVALRSSAAGGSVVYWIPVDGGWAFAQALPLLRCSRRASLDHAGFAEVARFGASYSGRTLLDGINRIPFGHQLVSDEGMTKPQPFAAFHSHPDLSGDDVAMSTIEDRLTGLASLLPARRHALFSGGVDSSLLAAILLRTPGDTLGVNLALQRDDPEARVAGRIAADMGLRLIRGELRTEPDDVIDTIGRYASPTLDFSVIPTHVVGALARAGGATTLVDGTGGDAWFGFRALGNDRVWRHIHHARFLRSAAARAYARLALVRDTAAWTPLKVVARAPTRPDAALAHLCASPLYDVVWRLAPDAWSAAEDDVAATLDRLLQHRAQHPWQRMVVADAAFIASGAFAAKSGQWSMVREQETIYPFLTPGLVEVARRLPRHMMLRDGDAKPLLKALAVRIGIKREHIYRKKAGFQPPLAALMRQRAVRDALEGRFRHEHELDPLMTTAARRMIRETFASDRHPSIHILYPFWNVLSMRLWLDELRSGAAAAHWCR